MLLLYVSLGEEGRCYEDIPVHIYFRNEQICTLCGAKVLKLHGYVRQCSEGI